MGQPVPVSVVALDPMLQAGAISALESSPDVEVVGPGEPARVTVVLVGRLGRPEVELIRKVRDTPARPEVVIVATELAATETLYAIAAGARGLLRRREAGADRLVRAVLTADMGDCTLPPDIFDHVVAQGAAELRMDGPSPVPVGPPGRDAPDPLEVHVMGPVQDEVLGNLRLAGVGLAARPDAGTVTLVVTDTVDRAIDTCHRGSGAGTVIVAERFAPEAVLRAARLGVRTLLAADAATPARLVAAVRSARHGDGRMPYTVLMRMLGSASRKKQPLAADTGAIPLTARQTSVLRLMADGHGNGEIATMLSCSEHTVKNAIYELMARLQVRNRAQAVASAIRTGLI